VQHCEGGILCGIFLLFSGVSSVLDGISVLLEAVWRPVVFAFILLAPFAVTMSGPEGYKQKLRDMLNEAKGFWSALKTSPVRTLSLSAFLVGYVIFFGSLFLASIGVQTWWKN